MGWEILRAIGPICIAVRPLRVGTGREKAFEGGYRKAYTVCHMYPQSELFVCISTCEDKPQQRLMS